MMMALGLFTVVNTVFIAAHAQQSAPLDKAFDRLVAPPGLLEDSLGADGPSTYETVGGSERFVFERTGEKATIRFLCQGSGEVCPEAAQKAQALVATQAGRGDIVFSTKGGVPVMRITSTGGATLYGGAFFVPSTVPDEGRAVIPAQ